MSCVCVDEAQCLRCRRWISVLFCSAQFASVAVSSSTHWADVQHGPNEIILNHEESQHQHGSGDLDPCQQSKHSTVSLTYLALLNRPLAHVEKLNSDKPLNCAKGQATPQTSHEALLSDGKAGVMTHWITVMISVFRALV